MTCPVPVPTLTWGLAVPWPLSPPTQTVLWLALTTILVLIAAGALSARRLELSHARLLSELQTQLAEHRKTEEALRSSEVFYHSLVENLPQSILRKDREGRFTFGNQRFCAALDLPLAAIIGKTDFDFYPAELAEKYRRDDQRVLSSAATFEAIESHVTPHGDKLYVQVIKTPLYDPQHRVIGVQGIFWDVTERKRAEEMLVAQNQQLQELARSEREAHEAMKSAQTRMVEAEKLASLGQLVAGVAHEINNPVAFVTNNVAVLQRDFAELSELLAFYEEARALIARELPALHDRIVEFREHADIDYTLANVDGLLLRSRDGLKRIQKIVSHLRLFAHLDEEEVTEADLNAGIESTVAIVVGNARRKRVRIELDLRPLPLVTCNPAKLNQVVMNLLTNAIDASPEEGTVTVRSRVEGESLCIEVADEGPGIPPEVRPRIFDPFYTTKPVGQGTGLGLSISYGIVHDHGGTIEVEGAPGAGARFSVHIPNRVACDAPSPVGTCASGRVSVEDCQAD